MNEDLAAFRFCPACGREGLLREGAKGVVCPRCGFRYFHNVAATVGLVIEVAGEILFTRRARAPAKGLLDFPGGFVDPGETVEQAVGREVREELGIELDTARVSYGFSACNRYPFESVIYPTADLYFILHLSERPVIRCADDVAAVEWYPRTAIPWDDLAFPAVRDAVIRLQEKAR